MTRLLRQVYQKAFAEKHGQLFLQLKSVKGVIVCTNNNEHLITVLGDSWHLDSHTKKTSDVTRTWML